MGQPFGDDRHRLAGSPMPSDIEQVFAATELSLLPAGARDLSMDCSCPDLAVPVAGAPLRQAVDRRRGSRVTNTGMRVCSVPPLG
jgi:hypothetical protein